RENAVLRPVRQAAACWAQCVSPTSAPPTLWVRSRLDPGAETRDDAETKIIKSFLP
ncbi:hypothetical protein chiPu_0021404, partial [Chiloscyllium punctatum]|nr:hypothetical protein [Chiloscyllium punctatum]